MCLLNFCMSSKLSKFGWKTTLVSIRSASISISLTVQTVSLLRGRFSLMDFVLQGMVIAETKRQMHETLEMKEEEIAQLRSRLQQATAQKEELQEQKEKAEKSGVWMEI